MFCFSRFCCFCSRNDVKLKHLHGIECNDLSFTAMAIELIPELGFSGLDSLLACESCTKCLKEMYVFRKNCSRNIRLLMKYAEELCTFGGFSGNVSVQLVDIGKNRDGSSGETEEIIEMENINIKSEPFYDEDPLRDNPESYHDVSSFCKDGIDDDRREIENFNVKSEPFCDDPLRDSSDPMVIKNEELEIKQEIYNNEFDALDPTLPVTTSDDGDFSCTANDAIEAATLTSLESLPESSRKKCESIFKQFTDWKTEKRASSISQNLLLEYFKELTKTLQSSSLWARYAILKSTLLLKENVDISNYEKLRAFLKKQSNSSKLVNETDEDLAKLNEMSSKPKKCCFVPTCTNTSATIPEKIFFTVPREKRRAEWFRAVKCENLERISSPRTNFFCCEDHFNLEEDMSDYMHYKLMPEYHKYFKIKPGVVPHIFQVSSHERSDEETSGRR